MKSWISFILPDDEYKNKKILHFLSEGGIVLFLSLIVMLVCNRYFTLDVETVLFLPLALFLFYVSGRYILSGIEYTDISTTGEYRKELRSIVMKTIRFVVIFMILITLYSLFTNVPPILNRWFDILGVTICLSVVSFLFQFISLKSSYKKNKELL